MKRCVINARFARVRTTGVQRSAYEIVSRLVAEDPERYRLVSPTFKINHTPLQVEQRGRIRQGHLWEQAELPRVVRKTGKDAVLYSPANSGPLAVGRQIVTVHDLFPIEHPEWFSRSYAAWYQWLLPRLMQRVARVVTNSHYTTRQILERYNFPEDKVVTCHFAQNESFVPAPNEKLEWFRSEQGLPGRYLLYIGSIEPRKNLTTLVAAWRQTQASQEGVKLVVAGAAGRKAVFNAANSGEGELKDDTIRQLGYIADEHLPLLYAGAEAFALPSLAEGFGLPVLEAMACGTPVLCSDNTALPEIADGAAQLIPARDVEAWRESIDAVLSNTGLRERMRTVGLRRATAFSWSKTAGAVKALLEEVR